MKKTKQTTAQAQQAPQGPLVRSASAILLESVKDDLYRVELEVASVYDETSPEAKRLVELADQLEVVRRKLDMVMAA